MKIKTLKFSLYLLAIITVFISCKDDDNDIPAFVERDRLEQQLADKDSILDYLSGHYYNSAFFETGVDHKYTDIIVTERGTDDDGNLLPVPDGHTLLIDDVETKLTTYLDVDYEYYILKLNEGGGDAPKFTDGVRVRYEGTSIFNGNTFDGVVTPSDLLLTGDGFTSFGVIRAWQVIFPQFKGATGFSFNNGAVDYNDFGLGIMYVPSGLGYFSRANTGLSYDNLIFKFELLQVQEVDHDNDGIPSYVEDLNNNLDVSDDNTDEDGLSDFVDSDDDGDGVLTINELIPTEYVIDTNLGENEPVLAINEYEINRTEQAGIITIGTVTVADSNDNNIPDYLEDTITINYNS